MPNHRLGRIQTNLPWSTKTGAGKSTFACLLNVSVIACLINARMVRPYYTVLVREHRAVQQRKIFVRFTFFKSDYRMRKRIGLRTENIQSYSSSKLYQ